LGGGSAPRLFLGTLPLALGKDHGVELAATGFMVPDVSWLYFALAQFPIYITPQLLRPLANVGRISEA